MKEVSEKITERIRKLIRLKESATQIGSEGEAHAAAAAGGGGGCPACLWNTTSPCLILPVRIHKTG